MKFGNTTNRKGLTELFNLPNWVIYRDSEYGMFAYNEELKIDHDFLVWKFTVAELKAKPNYLESLRNELKEREEKERKELENEYKWDGKPIKIYCNSLGGWS